jgi:peptidoglycan DL-endopeptidase CwlO
VRQHAAASLFAIGAVSLTVLLSVGSAAADPSQIETKRAEAQDVLNQIQLIDGQLEQAVERYNLANVQLGQIQADLKMNARHLVIARGSLDHAQLHLAKRLRALYVNGGDASSGLEVLLGAESLDDLLNRLEAIDRVGSQDSKVVRDVRAFKAEVKARKLRLEKAQVRQKQVVASRAEERRSIEGQLGSRQRMLASIKGQIAHLQAEEAARQTRLLQQARARVAEQRTAAAQSQADTALVDTPAEVAPSEAAVAAAPPSRYGGVVGIAMQYLGVPYVWGGASPSGFDCSGLIMYAYAQIGVSLPHHAASQYAMGVAVSRDALQPGDLVFFNGLGHAGIYIGGGQFIHAPHTGDVVKISSLSDSWYESTWVGARRIL